MKGPSIKERISYVLERIEKAAQNSQRRPEEITLVVVTKEASDADLEEALKTGLITDVGENRVQNLLKRLSTFQDFGVKVHLIGRLQTNKVKKIVGKVDLIQSLDREALLYEIQKRSEKEGIVTDVLLEVNISGEPSKAGVLLSEAEGFVEKILECRNVNLRGIMMMAPFIPKEECRPYFRKTFELFDKLKSELGKKDFDILSMGMSNDFEVAIEEGSNMVRIGSLIFKG